MIIHVAATDSLSGQLLRLVNAYVRDRAVPSTTIEPEN
jgi:hypothetical protein